MVVVGLPQLLACLVLVKGGDVSLSPLQGRYVSSLISYLFSCDHGDSTEDLHGRNGECFCFLNAFGTVIGP